MNETIYGGSSPSGSLLWIAQENRAMILTVLKDVSNFKKFYPYILAFIIASGLNGSVSIWEIFKNFFYHV